MKCSHYLQFFSFTIFSTASDLSVVNERNNKQTLYIFVFVQQLFPQPAYHLPLRQRINYSHEKRVRKVPVRLIHIVQTALGLNVLSFSYFINLLSLIIIFLISYLFSQTFRSLNPGPFFFLDSLFCSPSSSFPPSTSET